MAGRVDWPGRGPTWLGVPALVVALVGGLVLGEVTHRQGISRELLATGVETVAELVEVEVAPGKGSPLVDEVRVVFRTNEGRQVRTVLTNHEDDRQGMPERLQTPAQGTRYAMPLTIVYRRSDPSVALASVDARQWVADRETPRIGGGMLAGGLAVTLVAIFLLSRGARRRGLAWWQWYIDAPARHKNP